MYKQINQNERKELESIFADHLKTCITKHLENGCNVYENEIQGIKFRTTIYDDEVPQIVSLAIDVIEEFKNINNSGMNRERFKKIESELEEKYKNHDDEYMRHFFVTYGIIDVIKTDKLRQLIKEIAEVRRVGGAYWLLMCQSTLMSAIYAVYERIVDQFDNDELYVQSTYFMIRAIMKLHSDEIN